MTLDPPDRYPGTWQRLTRRQRLARWLLWFCLLGVVVVSWQASTAEQSWQFFEQSRAVRVLDVVVDIPGPLAVINDMLNRALPPDLAYGTTLTGALWDTINVATLGTVLATIAAAPIALLAARPTSPHPAVRTLALLVIVTSRSINSLIWALIFVLLFGPGLLAGILAIAVRSIGFTAKLWFEAIEECDEKCIQAVRATGAAESQVISHGIMPQVLPAVIGIVLFRWDINIRESAIIGYVGAGGIGLAIRAMTNEGRWDAVLTIFIMIFLLVLVSESLSAHLRRRVQ